MLVVVVGRRLEIKATALSPFYLASLPPAIHPPFEHSGLRMKDFTVHEIPCWKQSPLGQTQEITQKAAVAAVVAMDISLMVSLPVNELIKLLINQCCGEEKDDEETSSAAALPFIVDPAEEHIFQ